MWFSRYASFYGFILLLHTIQFCYADVSDAPVDEQTIQREIETLTCIPMEYYEVWAKIAQMQTSADQSEAVLKRRVLLIAQTIRHARDLLAEAKSNPLPEIPQFTIPSLDVPFRSGMSPEGIKDTKDRKEYEEYLSAQQLYFETINEIHDLESVLNAFEFIFPKAWAVELSVQKTKECINQEIKEKEFREYLLALLK